LLIGQLALAGVGGWQSGTSVVPENLHHVRVW